MKTRHIAILASMAFMAKASPGMSVLGLMEENSANAHNDDMIETHASVTMIQDKNRSEIRSFCASAWR